MTCRFFITVKLVAPPVSWWKAALVAPPMTTTASEVVSVAPPVA